MKKFLLTNMILIICFSWAGVNAQAVDKEIPPAINHYGGRYDFNSGNCASYAMSRAFGKADPRPYIVGEVAVPRYHALNWEHTGLDIQGTWFELIATGFDTVYINAQEKDIVGVEGNHWGYITSKSASTAAGIIIHYVTRYGGGMDGGRLDSTFLLTGADYPINSGQFKLYRLKKEWQGTFTTNLETDPDNTFYPNGSVKVSGTPKKAPYPFDNRGWAAQVTFQEDMHGKTHNGYERDFQEWTVTGPIEYYSLNGYGEGENIANLNHPSLTNQPLFTATYEKICEITLQNDFVDLPNQGKIMVDGDTLTISNGNPIVLEINERTSITLEAVDHVYNNIIYEFARWSDDDTNKSRIIYVTEHMDLEAEFIGKPQKVANVRSSSLIGENIKIDWDQHPNTDCYYKIWRLLVNNIPDDPSGPAYKVATKANNVLSWTDPDFKKTNEVNSTYTIKYDVRAYYDTESTNAAESYIDIFGIVSGWWERVPDSTGLEEVPIIREISELDIYPNPFNPETTIRFVLAKETKVDVAVYDIRGVKVRQLMEGFKAKGTYRVLWNGRNINGVSLGSGVYFLRLITNDKQLVKRMILMK